MRSLLLPLSVLALATSALAAPVPLFDGKSLEGWEGDTEKTWRIQDGAIVGGSLTAKVPRNEFLATTKTFKNFDLKLKFKLVGTEGFVNSGVQFRSVRIPKPPNEMRGYQADLGDPKWWGCIYDESRRNKVMAQSDMAKIEPVLKRQDWNDYRIRAVGPRIQIWINGVQTVDYTEADESIPQDGHIAVQIHGGGVAEAWFKDIEIEELPEDAKAQAANKKAEHSREAIDREQRPTPDQKNAAAQTPAKSAGVPAKGSGGRDLSYNADAATARTAEEERASFRLPEGFVAELVADESVMGKAVAFNFDNAGRMWVTTASEYPLDANEQPEIAERLYREGGKDAVLIFDTPWAAGLQKPRVFAGRPTTAEAGAASSKFPLAMPMGVLPYKDGAIVQHGRDLLFLRDTDGDGSADTREVLLTGFGIQDSHLMPHGFTRGPGDWIYFAQGAFNTSEVKTREGPVVTAKHCKLMRMKPDGSRFEVAGWGLNNIWGFVIDPRGEMWVQEANDMGYPVAPFQLGMAYPGIGSDKPKAYAPFMPKPRTLNDCSMGGTGLSGLALNEDPETWPAPWTGAFMVANPITNKIQAIRVHREAGEAHTKAAKDTKKEGDGSGAPRKLVPLHEASSTSYDDVVLEKLPDFLVSVDKCFRPVAIQFGPDGSLYVIDWYNKIISHNEVPRTHPDRDKTRSRIWRIRSAKSSSSFSSSPSSSPTEPLRIAANGRSIPDLTGKTPNQLVEYLGSPNQWQSSAARFALIDRPHSVQFGTVQATLRDETMPISRRIGCLWVLHARGELVAASENYLTHTRLISAVLKAGIEQYWNDLFSAVSVLWKDFPVEVRPALANSVSRVANRDQNKLAFLTALAHPLDHNGAQGAFERYLLRQAFENRSDLAQMVVTAKGDEFFLNSTLGTSYFPEKPSAEVMSLTCLAVGNESAAARFAELLPELKRSPDPEEVTLLARHVGRPRIRETLSGLLTDERHQQSMFEALAGSATFTDPALLHLISEEAKGFMKLNSKPENRRLLSLLARRHKITALEPEISSQLTNPDLEPRAQVEALRTLNELGSIRIDLFHRFAKSPGSTKESEELRREALSALASAPDPKTVTLIADLWPQLPSSARRLALDKLTSSKTNAAALVKLVQAGSEISVEDLDDSALEKLTSVLGADHTELTTLLNSIQGATQPVIRLNGAKSDLIPVGVDLVGPFTVEAWIKLAPGISNEDVLLGSPTGPNFNFYDGRLRVYAGNAIRDALVAKTPMRPEIWTHLAITRDENGQFRIYLDGQLDSEGGKTWNEPFKAMDIGRNSLAKGSAMSLAEFRIWNTSRTADQIQAYHLRSISGEPKPVDLRFAILASPSATDPGLVLLPETGIRLPQAFVTRSRDVPELLTQSAARALETKFSHYRSLAAGPGNARAGQALFAAACAACHRVKGEGGQIGPDLSGAGAMGTESLLRNILTPNAQLESGYYRHDIHLTSGDLVSGFLVKEDADTKTIRPIGGDDRVIPKKEIRSSKVSRKSLMPEGLLDGLPTESVRDLFAYLHTLK